ncbi:DNA topoisomerase IV subunit B [Jeotgalibaca dankookensis]|uniref:DNA topoisomerase IV subunit B n=1 Tax=Jeotgalibaca dankookensis TaxID=708126 RepID=UPI000780D8D9|nr:DNA topoisomerase IV subunit B [Jeotgalibaca dankookensis]
MKEIKGNQYNDASIQVLEGLDAVRKRPGMYIGSTDSRGLHHMVYEIVDNAVDEALSGFADEIKITIHKDQSVTVSDNGRGMPTGMHQSGVPTIQVIFTVLHAGGKFGQEGGYKTSGGLHGVGASVVNALSEFLEVSVVRDKVRYQLSFENGGKPKGKMKKTTKVNQPDGSSVHFLPDPQIFGKSQLNYDLLVERIRESAFLLKGLRISLTDERTNKSETFQYHEGIKEFVAYLNEEKDTLSPIAAFTASIEDIEVDFSFQYNDGYSETILSFVNNVRTKDGGTHEVGAKTGMTKAFNEYARKVGLLKEKEKNLEGSDVREGLTAVLSLRIPESILQFEGQTKEKLGTTQARSIVDNLINERLGIYLIENGEVGQMLIRKSLKAREARNAARKARELSRNGKKRKGELLLSGKLTPAQSKNAKKNELYLVEGDSAGGSAKQGRDRKFQAILPLRGKVINTERANMQDILKNEEISTIIHTVGAGVGADFDVNDSNYDKIIIMTDADTDGAHIQTLLLTFFYRYMKPLLEAGKIYLAQPPLYKVSKGVGKKEVIEYAWTEKELEVAIDKIGKGYIIQRYKGLGEMNADQLWETTMDPTTRTLIRVVVDDKALLERRVTTLMGNKVEPRRKWIEKNVEFSLEDDKSILEETNVNADTQMKKHLDEETEAMELAESERGDA